MHGASERDLQWYSECCCVASVAKIFTLEGVQTIHPSTPRLASMQNYSEMSSSVFCNLYLSEDQTRIRRALAGIARIR
jgi:hypothetical protein